MKIVIAPDSFKESLSAMDVAKAIEAGFRRYMPDASYVLKPVADGGEGTTEALVEATGGRFFYQSVQDPIGRTIDARWGVLGDGKTAVVEAAAASGLDLVERHLRNPLISCSFGTGQLIKAALDFGVESIILGLGGSATNDGGAGLLSALGAELLDHDGVILSAGGGALQDLHCIKLDLLDPRLSSVKFSVACDVDNPLIGKRGASAVFGPQKGAVKQQVEQLDSALSVFGQMLEEVTGIEVINVPGSGAAGGIGAALLACMNAELKSGIDIVMDAVGLDDALQDCQLLITGEGCIDSQTAYGKTPVGVAGRGKTHGCMVIGFAGAVRGDLTEVYKRGIDALFSIVPGVVSLDDALHDAEQNLKFTAANVASVMAMQGKFCN